MNKPDTDSEVPDWMSILAPCDDNEPAWVEITPERIAILSLVDTLEQLERSATDPNRLALAAKSAHLALQAALTAGLAGSANIGAHPEKLRADHLRHLEESRSRKIPRPDSDRVMGFVDLLAAARETSLEWSGKALEVTAEEEALLDRLTKVRHAVEHPKQKTHSIEPAYIKESLPVAARLTAELLEIVFHHLEPGELIEMKRAASLIAVVCAE